MSQVFLTDSFETTESLKALYDVVKVSNLHRRDLHRQVKFPKETHYKKSMESVYAEYVDLYVVEEVLKSKELKKGQTIKVLRSPAYDLEMMKLYHETGEDESPDVLTYIPKHKVDKNKSSFLFLNENSGPSEVFIFHAEEGFASEAAIKQALKIPPDIGTKK